MKTIVTPYCVIYVGNESIEIKTFQEDRLSNNYYGWGEALLKDATINTDINNMHILTIEATKVDAHCCHGYGDKGSEVFKEFLEKIVYSPDAVTTKETHPWFFKPKTKYYLKKGIYFYKKTETYKLKTTLPFKIFE